MIAKRSNARRRVALLVVAAAFLGFGSMPASATHIFSTNVMIEGTPVAAGDSFTNPTIFVNQGQLIDFSFDLFSTFGDPDTFTVDFSGIPFLADTSFAYDGTGTQAAPVNFLYTQSAGAVMGVFSGSMLLDFGTSFPDYVFPDGSFGSEVTIPFTVTVVPEPEIYAMLVAGLGMMGFVARRRKQRLAAA